MTYPYSFGTWRQWLVAGTFALGLMGAGSLDTAAVAQVLLGNPDHRQGPQALKDKHHADEK